MESLFIMPVVFVVFMGIYFMPAIVAYVRGHPSFVAIMVLNLLLGWSLVGWIVALVWAFSDMRVILLRSDDPSANNPLNQVEALEKLAVLRDKGVLTEEAFQRKKKTLLEA